MLQAQHKCMRAAGKMLSQKRRKLHSAKPALGLVLACICTTRMTATEMNTTSIEDGSLRYLS
jgi:hypothetical protein